MEHIHPFAFERVFALNNRQPDGDALDLHLQVLSLQAQAAASNAVLAADVQQARADGFAAGLAHARGETTAKTLAAAEGLSSRLDGLSERFAETEALMSTAATEVALAAAEVLAARAIAADPMVAIDAAIGRVLAQAGYRQALQAYVHPSLVASLETLVEGRQGVEQRSLTLTIRGDPEIKPGDVHIVWEQGGLSLDAAARNLAVRAELGLLLSA